MQFTIHNSVLPVDRAIGHENEMNLNISLREFRIPTSHFVIGGLHSSSTAGMHIYRIDEFALACYCNSIAFERGRWMDGCITLASKTGNISFECYVPHELT